MADFDLSLSGLPPQARQQLLAQVLQGQQRSSALEQASQQANRFNTLAAVAQMANNPGVAEAALLAQRNAQAQHKPVQMGQQGFALPSTGEFISSPMYEQDRKDRAEEKRYLLEQTLQGRRDAQQANLEAQAARAQERAEQRERDRQLRMTLEGMQGDLRRELAAAGAGKRTAVDEIKLGRTRDAAVQKYATQLEKAALPEFDQALEIAESVLTTYKPGKLPGYGRVMSAVPSGMLSNEGQLARTDMQMAANILLKARSGAAVTDSEMRRFLQEVATGAGMSEEAMRKGWANVRKAFDAKRQNLGTMLDDEGHSTYVERGGKDYRIRQSAPRPGDKYVD